MQRPEATTGSWSDVRGQRAVMLTTYRRDGRAVATPVGYGIEGHPLYFMTDPATGKVKRLRHSPGVLLAASTLRGEVKGPEVPGTARQVTGADAEHGRQIITSTNRLAWFFLQRKARRAGWDWVVYAVDRDEAPADEVLADEAPAHQSASTEETR